MQLRNARLCLDCEEVHDLQKCPRCASESFAFLTRWVAAPERRERPRPLPDTTPRLGASPEDLQAYRALLDPTQKANGRGWQIARQGAVGLALVGVAGWLWKSASAEAAADKASAAGRAEKEPQ